MKKIIIFDSSNPTREEVWTKFNKKAVWKWLNDPDVLDWEFTKGKFHNIKTITARDSNSGEMLIFMHIPDLILLTYNP